MNPNLLYSTWRAHGSVGQQQQQQQQQQHGGVEQLCTTPARPLVAPWIQVDLLIIINIHLNNECTASMTCPKEAYQQPQPPAAPTTSSPLPTLSVVQPLQVQQSGAWHDFSSRGLQSQSSLTV
jgi:hypothetical protein